MVRRVGNLLPTRFYSNSSTAVGWASQPINNAVGVAVYCFRLPERLSAITVDCVVPPYNDTCGVAVGWKPTLQLIVFPVVFGIVE